MKPNTVFSNLIIGNTNSGGQSNNLPPAPLSVNVHSDKSNRAIQSLNSRFTADETKREKTPADFLRQILVAQPIKSGKTKPEPLEMKLNKSPQKSTAADYNRAAWRAVFNKAGCGILTDGEIQQAVGAMRDNKLNTEFSGFNIDNLRRKDAQPGAMFINADKATVESAKRAAQAVLQYQEYKAKQSDANQERAQNEVNQMFADQGRVLWNSAVNIVEGTINTALDAASTGGGTNPLPLLNPNRPQVDFSGAKADYRSEMMRRDLNGKLDGDGIKMGQAVETGVTVLAPLVIGKVTTPTRLTELNLTFPLRNGTAGKIGLVNVQSELDPFVARQVGQTISENPVATRAYSQMQKFGTEVKLDFGKPPQGKLGEFFRYENESKIYMQSNETAKNAVGTLVHETSHGRSLQLGRPFGSQFDEFRAFTREFLFTEGKRPLSNKENLFGITSKNYIGICL